MPSETFFRLSESKQQRIIEAIKEEIARVPYEDFSIGNIIKKCSISRGSFYQYFKNKEDIYLFLIYGYQKKITDHMKETLQKNGGDFFEMLEATYRFSVRMLCYKDSKAFRHNLFCNIRLYEMLWKDGEYAEESILNYKQILEFIDTDKLHVQNEQELAALFDICMISALKDAAGIFMADYSEHSVLESFLTKLAFLKSAYQKA